MTMVKGLEEMPLFPLNTVLFPHAELQLHIFEERYRLMIQACINDERPFGIVLIRSGDEVGGPAEPYMVGTACRVTQVTHLDGGRMDIRVTGERRFRIREIDESQPYLVGYVEPVIEHDHADSTQFNSLVTRICDVFEALVKVSIARSDFNIRVTFPPDPVVLSFTMASFLTVDNLEKQRLLETTDTEERVAEMLPILENQLFETQMVQQSAHERLTTEHLSEWVNLN